MIRVSVGDLAVSETADGSAADRLFFMWTSPRADNTIILFYKAYDRKSTA